MIKGLFGQKKKYRWGDPEEPVDGLPPMGAGVPVPQDSIAQQPSPKFFGQGGVGRNIAGTIGDVLLQHNGLSPVYAPTMRHKQQQQFQEAQYERRRTDNFQDAMAMAKWKRENKEPDAFTQRVIASGVDPESPEGREIFRRKVENETMDWIEVSDGQGGKRIIPRPSQRAVTVTEDDWNNAKPIGGASSNASGGFRR